MAQHRVRKTGAPVTSIWSWQPRDRALLLAFGGLAGPDGRYSFAAFAPRIPRPLGGAGAVPL